MSRSLRIEFPGAWYHAMNRGRRSEFIFSKEKIIFQINAYSTVSSIIQTVSKLIKSDRRLKQQIEIIRDEISKGQM